MTLSLGDIWSMLHIFSSIVVEGCFDEMEGTLYGEEKKKMKGSKDSMKSL